MIRLRGSCDDVWRQDTEHYRSFVRSFVRVTFAAEDRRMVQRVTYRRRHPYKTRSNRVKIIRLPGGKLAVHYLRKKAKNAHCRISGARLHGLKALRPAEMHRAKTKGKWKTPKRKYGGNLSHTVVKERIVRAFLLEESKIVRRVLKLQRAKEKKSAR